MAQIRKNLAGEEDLAFDQNRNNETYEIVDSNGQLAIRHKINSKSIPVSADLVYGNNQNVYDYLVDLVELLNKFAVFEDTGASQLFFNKSQVDYIVVNSDLALLTKIPVGDVAVFAVGGSVQLNPEDFTVDGSIVTFLDGVFADGAKVACLYSTNDYAFPPLEDGDTDERIEQLEAEQVIQNVAIDARSKWIYPPKAQGELWIKNDWTRDGDWTMICNNDTTERPAPVPSGDQESSTPVEPVLITSDFSGFVQSGQVFTFTDSGLFQVVEVYVPTVSNDIAYRFLIIDETDINNPIVRIVDSPLLTAGEWNIITIGSYIVSVGTILRIQAEALNSGSSTEVTGGWLYEGTNNAGTPTTSEWNRSTQQDILRINKTDIDLISRDAELNGIIAGSKIQMAQTDTPSNSYTYTVNSILVDGTDYVEYSVTLDTTGGGGPAVGSATSMTATVPVPQLTEYSEEAGYYGSNSPNFADVTGFLTLGGAPQVSVDNSLFGVRINFQPYYNSPDWDIVAVASATGSSGGGGSGDFLPIVGGTMAGNIDMNKYDINRVGDMTLGEFSNFEREIKFRSSDEVLQTDYSARIVRGAGSNADFVIENLGAGNIIFDSEANVSLAGSRATDLADAVNPQDAVTKAVFDANLFNEYFDGFGASGRHTIYTGDLDNITENSLYNCQLANVTNEPPYTGTTSWFFIQTMMFHSNADNGTQITYNMNSGSSEIFIRRKSGGTWQAWKEIAIADEVIPLAGNSANPMTGDLYLGNNSIFGSRYIEMGDSGIDQGTYIDFHSSADPSQSDWSASVFRAQGLNGEFQILTQGAGNIVIIPDTGDFEIRSDIDLNNNNIRNVLDPVNALDAVNLQTLDAKAGVNPVTAVANISLAGSVVTINRQIGFSAIVYQSTGTVRFTLAPAQGSVNYTIIATCGNGSSFNNIVCEDSNGFTRTTQQFQIKIRDTVDGTRNPSQVNVVVYGV